MSSTFRATLLTVLVLLGLVPTMAVPAAALSVDEFGLAANAGPEGLTIGPDGKIWLTAANSSSIFNIDSDGNEVTTYSLDAYIPPGSANIFPTGIALGQDGNIWFTLVQSASQGGNKIGRLKVDATVDLYPLSGGYSIPSVIRSAPDGDLWCTEIYGEALAHITLAGVLEEIPVPRRVVDPNGLAIAADGTLWFAAQTSGQLVHYDPATHKFKKYRTRRSNIPFHVVVGPDGNIWYAGSGGIGRFDVVKHRVKTFSPPHGFDVSDLAFGPDGNIYYTQYSNDSVGKMTPQGVFTELEIPSASFTHPGPLNIIAGPDGNMWFSELIVSAVGRINLP